MESVFGCRWPAGMLALLVFLLAAAATPEKHLSVYSRAANYNLPIVQEQGRDYVGLLEVLEPLGIVNAKFEAPRWRLHFNRLLAEFTVGETHVRIQNREAELPAKFLMENGRGLVPVGSLGSLLPLFLGGPATLHPESDRLFIGNVAIHFTASVSPSDPSRLEFHFTAPVNPSLAAEPGKLRLLFRREPITAPASSTLTFGSKVIPSANYSESDGAAQIAVNTTVPLATTFSTDGRTIILFPAASPAAKSPAQPAKVANAPEPPSAPVTQTAAPPATTAISQPAARRYFAIVDASHGGDDRGEALSPTLAEKDVTVAFARRLRQDLESRGISTLVLRDSDANLSLDDRAFLANSAHAAVYIVVHAASNGHGVRLYTALLPYPAVEDRGPFHPFITAQASFIPLSQAAMASVALELRKVQVSVRTLTAPLRPLNNIVTAAIAVEVAPPAADISALTAPDYQQLITGSVANGIAAIRGQLGAAP